MYHLSASAVFSPSVARQQLAAAKDWNYIDGWLSSKFNGKPAPPFERNNDTLKALLALAALNESADEEQELLSKVDAKALVELQAQTATDPDIELLNALEDNLTREGHTCLDAIAAAGMVLNQPFADTDALARRVSELQVTSFDLDQAQERITILQDHVDKELEAVNRMLQTLRSDEYTVLSELPKQTLDQQRATKILVAKLPDLRDRVAALTTAAGTPNPTIEDMKAEEDRFKGLSAVVKKLETQVKSYHGLPHDTDLARLELESLRVEVQNLTRERDAIFEGLVESGSPRRLKHRSRDEHG